MKLKTMLTAAVIATALYVPSVRADIIIPTCPPGVQGEYKGSPCYTPPEPGPFYEEPKFHVEIFVIGALILGFIGLRAIHRHASH